MRARLGYVRVVFRAERRAGLDIRHYGLGRREPGHLSELCRLMNAAALLGHRCAVCWQRERNHADWFKHCTLGHGAELAPFGFDVCFGFEPRTKVAKCPGLAHDKKLPNYGAPVQRRERDLGAPVKGRDGLTYTPIPLFGGTNDERA